MERTQLIDHLIEHYIARDHFRILAEERLRKAGLPYSVTFIDTFHGPPDKIAFSTVETTKKSLLRCKHKTIVYLHELLHEDFMLSKDEHVHGDEGIFSYIIHEALEATDALRPG